MRADRGIAVDNSTLYRWVIRLTAFLDKAFRQHKRSVDRRWRMDETCIKIKGRWKYRYRAIDTSGQTIDFLLTSHSDTAAALHFFRKAIRQNSEPVGVTIDERALLQTGSAGEKVNCLANNLKSELSKRGRDLKKASLEPVHNSV